LQNEHQRTQAANTAVGDKWARALRLGTGGNSVKSQHGTCHPQELNLWLGEANEATASQH